MNSLDQVWFMYYSLYNVRVQHRRAPACPARHGTEQVGSAIRMDPWRSLTEDVTIGCDDGEDRARPEEEKTRTSAREREPGEERRQAACGEQRCTWLVWAQPVLAPQRPLSMSAVRLSSAIMKLRLRRTLGGLPSTGSASGDPPAMEPKCGRSRGRIRRRPSARSAVRQANSRHRPFWVVKCLVVRLQSG